MTPYGYAELDARDCWNLVVASVLLGLAATAAVLHLSAIPFGGVALLVLLCSPISFVRAQAPKKLTYGEYLDRMCGAESLGILVATGMLLGMGLRYWRTGTCF